MQWRNQRRALSNHSCLAEDSTTNHAVLGCGGKHWDQKHRARLGAIIHEKAAESQVSAQVDHDGDFWSIARDVRGSPAHQLDKLSIGCIPVSFTRAQEITVGNVSAAVDP